MWSLPDRHLRDGRSSAQLDSKTHTLIDEFSTSNFLALKYGPSGNKEDVTLVVPESPSILKSITTMSVIDLATKTFGWRVELRPVAFSEVANGGFDEVAAAGTAAVRRCGCPTDVQR